MHVLLAPLCINSHRIERRRKYSYIILSNLAVITRRIFLHHFQAHILNLLRSKFTSFRDFHTMLYTCAAEFDFISLSTIYRLSSTLLLPIVYIAVGSVTLYAAGIGEMTSNSGACQKRTVASLPMKKQRESRRDLKEIPKSEIPSPRKVDAAVQYNILQLIAFIIMAAIIMRLKLFMSPHLCIMASLVASKKVYILFFLRNSILYFPFLTFFFFSFSTCFSSKAN
jgi:hypothetical protein